MEELKQMLNGFPDAEIIKQTIEKMEQESLDEDIMKSILEFLIQRMKDEQQIKHTKRMKKIYEIMDEINKESNWNQAWIALNNISIYSSELASNCFKKYFEKNNGEVIKDVQELIEVKAKIAKMNIPDIKMALDRSWTKENAPRINNMSLEESPLYRQCVKEIKGEET
jgi:hypothetical protein